MHLGMHEDLWACHFVFRLMAALKISMFAQRTVSQSDDQIRRNHSVQYFAYPDFRFGRLHREEPERYETYADIKPAQWIHFKIVVSVRQATLFLNNSQTPALIVNDLKLGAAARGGIGIWIESGTIAWFSNLNITPEVD